jgi:hypothetical protein
VKQIRALSSKGRDGNDNRVEKDDELYPDPIVAKKPHFLATQRRVAKQEERGGSCSRSKVVVCTRDVRIVSNEIGVVLIGVKRSSINRAKGKLAKLISRGASKRRITRAERKVEFAISKEKSRKEREAEKKEKQ